MNSICWFSERSMDTGLFCHQLAQRLFPICRSITGPGVRETLAILAEHLPGLKMHEVPSGYEAFDWVVPDEWVMRDGFIEDESGQKVVDFKKHNLHILGYSTPIDQWMSLDELDKNLHSHHPFFSVSIMGDRKELFRSASLTTCFGKNSLFDILHNLNETDEYEGKVKFITFGITLPPEAITYIHSIEEKFAVPYRYHKNFKGSIRSGSKVTEYDVQFFVRDLATEVLFDADACWNLLKTEDGIKTEALGDSVVAMLPERVVFSSISKRLTQACDFLCKGGYKKCVLQIEHAFR